MQKPILITGATGTIGNFLKQELLSMQHPLHLAVRNPQKFSDKDKSLVETVYFDYKNEDSRKQALQGIEQLFWLTPSPTQMKSEEAFDEIALAIEFLAEMKQAGVKHIVRISGMGADQYKESAHFQIEELIRQSGISYTILRPAFFMQIFSSYYREGIRKENRIHLYDASVREAFVDARDIAAVAAKSFVDPSHRHQIYTLTSGELLNYADIADLLTKTLNREITYTAQSDADSIATLIENGWDPKGAEIYTMFLQAAQQGVFSVLTNDVEKVLGRDPISFQQYVRDYASMW